MSLRLKGQIIGRQGQYEGQYQKATSLSPFGFVLLACETCVLKYIQGDLPAGSVDKDFWDLMMQMRWAYPKKLVPLRTTKSKVARKAAKISKIIEEALKMSNPLSLRESSVNSVARESLLVRDRNIFDSMIASHPHFAEHYYQNLRIWSLGLALTFLDPKVGKEAELLEQVRQCPNLRLGNDFKIDYAQALDPELYRIVKKWWQFIENLRLRDKKYPQRKLRFNDEVWDLEIRERWRGSDLKLTEPYLLREGSCSHEIMRQLYNRMLFDPKDDASLALTKKYFRGLARQIWEADDADAKAIKLLMKRMEPRASNRFNLSQEGDPLQDWSPNLFLSFLKAVSAGVSHRQLCDKADEAKKIIRESPGKEPITTLEGHLLYDYWNKAFDDVLRWAEGAHKIQPENNLTDTLESIIKKKRTWRIRFRGQRAYATSRSVPRMNNLSEGKG